ncbi:hypothetical protein [Burkholderia pseudomallei]|uniref:hypothetical protein n=1 Tax=Burkholderia pseudomallei TaxID=28450 RepID=UPI0012AED5EE|nr:hypothetical protein [Burkholderia pseudomallei]
MFASPVSAVGNGAPLACDMPGRRLGSLRGDPPIKPTNDCVWMNEGGAIRAVSNCRKPSRASNATSALQRNASIPDVLACRAALHARGAGMVRPFLFCAPVSHGARLAAQGLPRMGAVKRVA